MQKLGGGAGKPFSIIEISYKQALVTDFIPGGPIFSTILKDTENIRCENRDIKISSDYKLSLMTFLINP